MINLITSLIKAKKAFAVIKKDKVNPHFKSKYATLDSVLDAVTEPLSNNGIAIVQLIEQRDTGLCLITNLYHESGEKISDLYPLPANLDPQKLGSAITYARRYALCAMLSVSADEDDDGNNAKPTTPKKSTIFDSHSRISGVLEELGVPKEERKDLARKAIITSCPENPNILSNQLTLTQCDLVVKVIYSLWDKKNVQN